MGVVNTVLGPIKSNDLGLTMMHEHLIFGYPGYQGDVQYAEPEEVRILDKLCPIVEKLMQYGVRTIVDATPNDCGRWPQLYQRVSKMTGINIICASGYYNEELGGSAYFKLRALHHDAEEEIYELLKKETTTGIGRTGIKAGVVKLASGKDKISDYEKMFFKAAAKVQQEFHIPIITHTEEGKLGCEQLDFLLENGADANKVLIGHMCDDLYIQHHRYIMDKGAYVGFDRFSVQGFLGVKENTDRFSLLKRLVDHGYADRILFSQDFVMHQLGREQRGDSHIVRMHAEFPCDCLFKKILPQVKETGISEDGVNEILVKNPQIFLDTDIF